MYRLERMYDHTATDMQARRLKQQPMRESGRFERGGFKNAYFKRPCVTPRWCHNATARTTSRRRSVAGLSTDLILTSV